MKEKQLLRESRNDRLNDKKKFNRNSKKGKKMQPQMGIGTSLVMKTMLNRLQQSDISDAVISKIEGLAALVLCLVKCTSTEQAMSIMFLYLKTHITDKSIFATVSSCLHEILHDDVEPQSGGIPDWISSLKTGLSNWKLVVQNPGFKKLSKLISLFVTLFVTEGKCDLNIGNLKVFSFGALEKQASALDFVDALLDTVVFFVEGGYLCFKMKSLKPLLYSVPEIVTLEGEYIKILELWEHARNGNLHRFCGMDETEFDKMVVDLTEKFEVLYKTTPPGSEKKILCDRWRELTKIYAEFTASRVRGGLRIAPYCFKVYGNSGVGKSSIVDYLMVSILKANNFPSDDNHICTLNDDDKYMSTYRSYITGVKLDDFANTKSDKVEQAPTRKLIDLANNIKLSATMADVANKGKVSIEPKVVSISTNKKNLDAALYSNEPLSILRRAHLHLDVKVKRQFCKIIDGQLTTFLDSTKVNEHYENDVPDIPDLWDITCEEVVAKPSSNHQTEHQEPKFVPVYDDAGKMTDVSIYRVLKYVINQSKVHFTNQVTLMEATSNMSEKIEFCERCNTPCRICECEPLDCDEQFGERTAGILKGIWKGKKYGSRLRDIRQTFESEIEDVTIQCMLTTLKSFEDSRYCRWTNWIPTQFFDNRFVYLAVSLVCKERWEKQAKRELKTFSFVTLFLGLVLVLKGMPIQVFGMILAILLSTYVLGFTFIVEMTKERYYEKLRRKNGVMPQIFKTARDKHIATACKIFAGASACYLVYKLLKALKTTFDIQGTLTPTTEEEIQKRDSEESPWSKFTAEIPSISASCKTMTFSQAQAAVARNQYYMEIDDGSDSYRICNAFFVTSNVAIIPQHIVPSEVSTFSFTRRDTSLSNATFRAILNPSKFEPIEGTDLTMIYVPTCGSIKNLLHLFPETISSGMTCVTESVYRDIGGEISTDHARWDFKTQCSNGARKFFGSYYRLEKPTFKGLCMATHISQGRHPYIAGFHLGGVSNNVSGVGGTVLQVQVATTMKRLLSKGSHMEMAEQGDTPSEIMNKKVLISDEVHKRSPLGYLSGETNVSYLGQATGRAEYHSNVIKTPISDVVEEVTGVECKWGKPKFHRWRPWQTSLEITSKPCVGFDEEILNKAVVDYELGLMNAYLTQKTVWEKEIRPLTEVETVSGIDGKRFIDGMVAKTSVGYPLGGPKKNYMVELEEEFPNVSCPKIFVEEIMKASENARNSWASGKRAMCIFGSALKDEPTKLTSEKVRVFQAAPIILQLNIRKYFLPIARFLSMNPIVCECAVGINAHGAEWDQLSRHMFKHGKERIFAGDYSKYDSRMPAQYVIAAFNILINFAKRSGNYTERDLKIMRGIVTEVAYPIVNLNGDLIMYCGTNPSGQNLTAYINSIVNSLLLRSVYYTIYNGPSAPKFSDVVSIATYGDDVKGSVSEDCPLFNIKSAVEVFKKNDIIFTMPDKESEIVEYMDDETADFLKRKNRFDETLKHHVGMLDESSIFKSLHTVLESKECSPIEVAAQNIDGALREWFFHGKDHFEMRRDQMKKIAEKSKIIHMVRTLNDDWDSRADAWIKTYSAE